MTEQTVAAPAPPTGGSGTSIGRVLAVLVVVALVMMWLWIFSGAPRRDAPDKLDDEAFGAQAEQVCARALAEIGELPLAPSAESADDRAEVLDRSTDVLDTMVDELRTLAPDGDDGALVGLWLDDWETYNDDRRRWADALRADPDARFLVTEKAGQQITDPLDEFARVNEMESCETPMDA